MSDLRCNCGAPLITDEGRTVRVSMKNWRMNKETGRVTADCANCTQTYDIDAGNWPNRVQQKRTVKMIFAVGF